jgi:hypothetical protein
MKTTFFICDVINYLVKTRLFGLKGFSVTNRLRPDGWIAYEKFRAISLAKHDDRS